MSGPVQDAALLVSDSSAPHKAEHDPDTDTLSSPVEYIGKDDDTRSIFSMAPTLIPGEYVIGDHDEDKGAVDQASLDSVLIQMSGMGDAKPIRTLLQRGANAKARERGGDTALHKAAAKGSTQIVALLLQYGADPNVQGNWYGSPLQVSTKGGHVQIVKDLIAAGANVNDTSGLYGPALQLALNENNPEMVRVLLEAGADVKLVTLSTAQRQLQAMVANGLVALKAEARKSAKSWAVWKISW